MEAEEEGEQQKLLALQPVHIALAAEPQAEQPLVVANTLAGSDNLVSAAASIQTAPAGRDCRTR